jgi:hypothetical protein
MISRLAFALRLGWRAARMAWSTYRTVRDYQNFPQSAGGSVREAEQPGPVSPSERSPFRSPNSDTEPAPPTPAGSGPSLIMFVLADGKSCRLIAARNESELRRISDYQHDMARVTCWGGVA